MSAMFEENVEGHAVLSVEKVACRAGISLRLTKHSFGRPLESVAPVAFSYGILELFAGIRPHFRAMEVQMPTTSPKLMRSNDSSAPWILAPFSGFSILFERSPSDLAEFADSEKFDKSWRKLAVTNEPFYNSSTANLHGKQAWIIKRVFYSI